jgi:hypothetical protein
MPDVAGLLHQLEPITQTLIPGKANNTGVRQMVPIIGNSRRTTRKCKRLRPTDRPPNGWVLIMLAAGCSPSTSPLTTWTTPEQSGRSRFLSTRRTSNIIRTSGADAHEQRGVKAGRGGIFHGRRIQPNVRSSRRRVWTLPAWIAQLRPPRGRGSRSRASAARGRSQRRRSGMGRGEPNLSHSACPAAMADYRIAACRRKGWVLAMLAKPGRNAACALLRVAPVPGKRAFAPSAACRWLGGERSLP